MELNDLYINLFYIYLLYLYFNFLCYNHLYCICIVYINIYIYVWKLNQTVLELDFRAVKFFVLPSTGFEPTPLLHCSTIRLALPRAP